MCYGIDVVFHQFAIGYRSQWATERHTNSWPACLAIFGRRYLAIDFHKSLIIGFQALSA